MSQAAIKGEEWIPVEPKQESSGPTIIPEPRNPPPRRPHLPSNQLWDVLPGTIAKQNVCDIYLYPRLYSVCCEQWTSLRFCKLRQVQSVVNYITYLCHIHGLHGLLTFGSIRCNAKVAGCVCMHERENESKLGCVWSFLFCFVFYVHGCVHVHKSE